MLISLLILASMLSACAPEPPRMRLNDEPTAVSDEAEVEDAPSREAVFTYNDKKEIPKRLVLSLAGEPLLLPSGYARLAGVVRGEKPIALIEIGGRGLALAKGESIDDYRVVRVDGDNIVLERRK